MVVPIAARWVAAALGALLVLSGWQSVIGTLIVPRPPAERPPAPASAGRADDGTIGHK